MSDRVWDLGQELLTAAWETARALRIEDQATRVGELLDWVEDTQAQLAGLQLRILHEAKLAGTQAVIDRVRVSTRTTAARAAAALRLASDLAERFPLISEALCDGVISAAQAEAMVTGLKTLPVTLNGDPLRPCQTELLDHADVLGPRELRILAVRMLELVDPETAEDHEATQPARQERRAKNRRSLRITPDFHGSMRITGHLPTSDGALLQAQLDALLPPLSSYPAEAEAPSVEARRAAALVLLTQAAAASGEVPDHGLDRPQVHITLDLEALTTGLGTVGLLGDGDGQRISAGEARRLACDPNLVPVVLGGPSQPLDVGRTHRLVPKPLRAALIHRDHGCAFPHCAARPAACEAHHIRPWWAGGTTDLANTVLLCPRHHRLVEPDPGQSDHSQWQVRIEGSSGMPLFIPPNYIDPARKPRRHRRHLLESVKTAPRSGGEVCPDASPPAFGLPPLPDPVDDPWHPDYQPLRTRTPLAVLGS